MEIKPAMVAIAAFVVITVIAAVLMPVLDDATETQATFTNEGMYFINDDPTESHTITFASNVITIDGSIITPTTDARGCTIFATEDTVMRYDPTYHIMQLKGAGGYYKTISACNLSIASGTISGTVTVNGVDSSVSISFTELYLASNEQTDSVMTEYNGPAYMLSDSPIFAMGQSAIGTTVCLVKIEGTIESVNITFLKDTNGDELTGVTVTDLVIDTEEVNSAIGVYKLNKITFTASYGGQTSDMIYSAYIVPYQVTAEKSVHLTANENAILLVIPALAIIAIIIGILAYAIRMRE